MHTYINITKCIPPPIKVYFKRRSNHVQKSIKTFFKQSVKPFVKSSVIPSVKKIQNKYKVFIAKTHNNVYDYFHLNKLKVTKLRINKIKYIFYFLQLRRIV